MSAMRLKCLTTQGEIDGGMLVLSNGSGTVLVTIYQPPSTPPSGWDSTKIYYSRTSAAWPSGRGSTISVAVSAGPPTGGATTFGSGTALNLSQQTASPVASSTLFMQSGGAWGVDLSNLTGTGSSTSGSAVWWNNSSTDIAVANGATLGNYIAGSTGTTYEATDSLGS